MAYEVCIPRLGWSMEEGVFVGWLKQEGDLVQAGEPLFELEGEKGLQEVEAVDGGILRIPPDAPRPGSTLPVGTLLGYLVRSGEAAPWETDDTPLEFEPASRLSPVGQRADGSEAVREEVSDLPPLRNAPSQKRERRERTTASPRARRIARELGVDWPQVAGTGVGGRVREADVRQAAAAEPGTVSAKLPVPAESQADGTIVALSPRRKTIAQRMLASHTQTAPVTLTTRCDVTALVELRKQFKAAGGVVPAYTDFAAKLSALVLGLHPELAATWSGDQLRLPAAGGLDISIAVDTPEGLVVPVLRDAGRRTLIALANDSQRLIEQARTGRLTAADMQGGVFTITNLGSYGIDAFTPIISPPQVAILGLGTIRREPVVLPDDQIVPRELLTLSLTFDHRALDGAPAARCLQTLSRAFANPAAWLLGIEGQPDQHLT